MLAPSPAFLTIIPLPEATQKKKQENFEKKSDIRNAVCIEKQQP